MRGKPTGLRADRLAARLGSREGLASKMRLQRKLAREKVRQGAFLLPSLLTVGSVFLSFWAIVSIYNLGAGGPAGQAMPREGVLTMAAWLLFAAFWLDGLDGKVARLTGTTSEFGLQLDSLADVLSFGMAPALLAYSWVLHPFGRVGWLISFLFVICGACRLARFNVQTTAAPDKRYFTGLPIPCAALTIAAMVLNFPVLERSSPMAYAMLGLVVVLSFLMVSKIRYRSFKDIDLRRARSPRSVVLIALFISVLVAEPELVIMLLMAAMVFSGPVARVIPERFWGPPKKAAAAPETRPNADSASGPVAVTPSEHTGS